MGVGKFTCNSAGNPISLLYKIGDPGTDFLIMRCDFLTKQIFVWLGCFSVKLYTICKNTRQNDVISIMYTLVYLSSASVLFSEEQLQAILAVSRRNNERLDITGILLYHEGAILQALEGEERPVMECYQRILLDDRHRGVIRIIDGHSDERCFPDWSMGFRQLNAEQWEAVSGYRPIGSGALQFKEMSGPGVAQDMVTFIRSFCRTNFKS